MWGNLVNLIQFENRLGQTVDLEVASIEAATRDFIFVRVPGSSASSVVKKNAEHFAFQLRHRFNIAPERFELIELKGDKDSAEFWRWRFEWVGSSPILAGSELVKSAHQQSSFKALLDNAPINRGKEVNIA